MTRFKSRLARVALIVLAPLIAVIVFLALDPQVALHRSEESVKTAVYGAQSEALLHGAPRSATACPPLYAQRFQEVTCGAGFTHLTYSQEAIVIK